MGKARKKAAHLPEEIVVEILSRLPIKLLFRCKIVCKLWKCIIQNPNFVISGGTERERVIVGYLPHNPRDDVIDAESKRMYFYSMDDKLSVERLPDPVGEVPSRFGDFRIFGTCEGLILFWAAGAMYLWNTSRGWCRLMTQLNGLAGRFRRAAFRRVYGFCFDKSYDDYKAVLVTKVTPRSSVFLTSLRSGETLKNIEFPYTLPLPERNVSLLPTSGGVLMNGHLHWLVERDQSQLIIYFDEEINLFREFPMPEKQESNKRVPTLYFGLAVLHGSLCISEGPVSSVDKDYDVLIMREYGVQSSWTKLFRVRGQLVPLHTRFPENKVLVFRPGYVFYTFNIGTKCLKRIQCPPSSLLREIMRDLESEQGRKRRLVMSMSAGPLMYMESLASPDSI